MQKLGGIYKHDIPGSADSGDFTEIWWNDSRLHNITQTLKANMHIN